MNGPRAPCWPVGQSEQSARNESHADGNQDGSAKGQSRADDNRHERQYVRHEAARRAYSGVFVHASYVSTTSRPKRIIVLNVAEGRPTSR